MVSFNKNDSRVLAQKTWRPLLKFGNNLSKIK